MQRAKRDQRRKTSEDPLREGRRETREEGRTKTLLCDMSEDFLRKIRQERDAKRNGPRLSSSRKTSEDSLALYERRLSS